MKDVNIACKCYDEPQDDCPADVHFKQFETDQWAPPEMDGLAEMVDGLQQDIGLSDEQRDRVEEAIAQCYRPQDKMRQFFMDWHYARYPEQRPPDDSRDPAKLDALLEAVRELIKEAAYIDDAVGDVGSVNRCADALAAFEGGENDGR